MIKNLCIWYLTKYFRPTYEKMSVGKDVSITLKGYIKPNEDWQHHSMNISFWLKAEKDTEMFSEIAVYQGGELTEKFMLLEGLTGKKNI